MTQYQQGFFAPASLIRWDPSVCSSADGVKRILASLSDLSHDTQFIDIQTPEQVMFDSAGKTLLGKMVRPAFNDLANKLAPGLAGLVSDVADPPSRQKSQRAVSDQIQMSPTLEIRNRPDPVLAASIFNEVARRRFELLVGLKAVVSRSRGVCEGFVSSSYHWYSHWEAFQNLLIFSKKTDLWPREVKIHNRQFVAYMASQKPLFVLPPIDGQDDRIHWGLVLRNDETGKAAVSVARAIFRPMTGTFAVQPPAKDRLAVDDLAGDATKNPMKPIAHLWRADWDELIQKMSLAASTGFDSNEIELMRQRLLSTQDRSLNLVPTPNDRRKQVQTLARSLAKVYSVSSQVWVGAIEWAVARGSGSSGLGASLHDAYSQRTYYDLFNAVSSLAKGQTVVRRLVMERLAFALGFRKAVS